RISSFDTKWQASKPNIYNNMSQTQLLHFTTRASHSMNDKNKVYKQLGFFSLKKKIEDAVQRAEIFAPTALELEQAKQIKNEEMICDYNLWDDPVKSNDILVKLADGAKVVDDLKDLKYKAEEAKLIMQLAEMDAINYGLFKQAYNASLYVTKFLDHYKMSKLLRGPYDMEGACLTITAGSGGTNSEIWAEQVLNIYTKWAMKQANKGRIVEKQQSMKGGIKLATIEFEFKHAYGYLSGESGVHHMISHQNGSIDDEAISAGVDVVPLFLGAGSDLQINDEEMIVSSSSLLREEQRLTEPTVRIRHIPTGICVQSSGERSHFANKIKALNRLKAKLLVIVKEQGVINVSSIKKEAIVDVWQKDTRRYVSHPYKLVEDVKTGFQLPDLNSVLDGNIEPLLGAYINSKQSSDHV
ncbi:RF-1 domain-containing protein/PCRF domain-containing protein, partial [Cephalotus follicularis]